MGDVYTRCNNVDELHTLIKTMLVDVGVDYKFLSEALKSRIIDELIETDIAFLDPDSFRDLLKSGFKGYSTYTHMELIDVVMGGYYNDMCADDEFEGSIWHAVEQGLLTCKTLVINEATDKHLLGVV